jgi:hypothetical protein
LNLVLGEKSGRAKSATSIPTPAQPPHICSRWQQIQAVGAGRWIPQPQRLSIPALGLAPSERERPFGGLSFLGVRGTPGSPTWWPWACPSACVRGPSHGLCGPGPIWPPSGHELPPARPSCAPWATGRPCVPGRHACPTKPDMLRRPGSASCQGSYQGQSASEKRGEGEDHP